MGSGIGDMTINICKNVTKDCNGKNNYTPSLWYNWNDPKKCYAAGRLTKPTDIDITLIDPSDPFGGVKIRYKNGDTYDHGLGPEKEGQTEFSIKCDPNSENTKPEADGLPLPDGPAIVYKYKFISKHACPK